MVIGVNQVAEFSLMHRDASLYLAMLRNNDCQATALTLYLTNQCFKRELPLRERIHLKQVHQLTLYLSKRKGNFYQQEIAEIMRKNTTIKNFAIGFDNVAKENMLQIVETIINALKKNETLIHLGLLSNRITTVLPHLFDVLREHPTLTSLNIHRLNIENHQAHLIASALRVNTTLQCLQLGQWNQTVQSQYFMQQALAVNATLRRLSAQPNHADQQKNYQKDLASIFPSLQENKMLFQTQVFYVCGGGLSMVIALMREQSSTITDWPIPMMMGSMLNMIVHSSQAPPHHKQFWQVGQ